MLKYVICLCKGCDGCCIVMRGAVCVCYKILSDSSCRCCMFSSCVHPVAVINVAFCMTCSFLMLVKNARGDHMEDAYCTVGLMVRTWDVHWVKKCMDIRELNAEDQEVQG